MSFLKDPDLLLKLFMALVVCFLGFAILYYFTDNVLAGFLFVACVSISMIVFGWRCVLVGEIKPGYSYLHYTRNEQPLRFWIVVTSFIGGGTFVILWGLFMLFYIAT